MHDDHFLPDARDETWLKLVGKRGWVVFTKDRRIRYRTAEVAALLASGVRAFALTGGDLRGEEMAAILVSALPRIQRFLGKNKGPFIAKVTRGGQVQMILSRRPGK